MYAHEKKVALHRKNLPKTKKKRGELPLALKRSITEIHCGSMP